MAEWVRYHQRDNTKHKDIIRRFLDVPASTMAALAWFHHDKCEDAQKVEGGTPRLT